MPAPQAFLGAVSFGVGVAAWHVYQKKAIAREEEEARKERDKLAQDYRERAEQRRQKEGSELCFPCLQDATVTRHYYPSGHKN